MDSSYSFERIISVSICDALIPSFLKPVKTVGFVSDFKESFFITKKGGYQDVGRVKMPYAFGPILAILIFSPDRQ
jgi:hypothetical protein